MKIRFSHLIVLAICAAVLVGCGSDKEKKRTDKDRTTRVTMRAEEVRKRIDDLQHSLVQLYQETEIQQMKIRAAQENLAALRKSLGDFARSSRAYEETSAAISAPIQIPRLNKADEAKAPESEKKKKENRTLETLLILAFAAFLVTVAYKLYQKKTGTGQEESSEEGGDSYTIIKPPARASDVETDSGAPEKVEPSDNSTREDGENPSHPSGA